MYRFHGTVHVQICISIAFSSFTMHAQNIQDFPKFIGEINMKYISCRGDRRNENMCLYTASTNIDRKWSRILDSACQSYVYYNYMVFVLRFYFCTWSQTPRICLCCNGLHFYFMTTQAHQRVLCFNWISYRIYSHDENFHVLIISYEMRAYEVPTWALST